MTTTNGDFLKQKVANMCTYCRGILSRLVQPPDLSGRLDELERAPIEWLVSHIVSDVVPHSNNIPAYVEKMCHESGINHDSLLVAEREKLGRYVECLIAVCNS